MPSEILETTATYNIAAYEQGIMRQIELNDLLMESMRAVTDMGGSFGGSINPDRYVSAVDIMIAANRRLADSAAAAAAATTRVGIGVGGEGGAGSFAPGGAPGSYAPRPLSLGPDEDVIPVRDLMHDPMGDVPVPLRDVSHGPAGSGAGGRYRNAVGWDALFAGAAMLTPIVAAAKSGAEFENQLHRLQATAGDTTPWNTLRRSILDVSNQFDQMPAEAAKALYPIESGGFKGADGMKVLAASAAFARGTQTDLGLTTDLVTKTLIGYRKNASDAAQTTDILARAVKNSLVSGQEFVPALANITTMGSNANISLAELTAALDVMTQHTKSAATGSTYLKNFINGLISPTEAMRKAFNAASAGLAENGDVVDGHIMKMIAMKQGAEAIKEVGFPKVLEAIYTATNGNVSAMDTLFPDMRKSQSEMILFNDGLKLFNKTLDDNKNSAGAVHAANVVMDNDMAQMGKDIQSLAGTSAAGIENGLKPAMLDLGHEIESTLKWFNSWPNSAKAFAAGGVAIVGSLLVVGGALRIAAMAFQGITDAIAATRVAMAAMSIEGIAAMGPGAALFLTVAGLVVEVGYLAKAWQDVKDAQEAASESTGAADATAAALQRSNRISDRIIGDRYQNQKERDAIEAEMGRIRDIKARENLPWYDPRHGALTHDQTMERRKNPNLDARYAHLQHDLDVKNQSIAQETRDMMHGAISGGAAAAQKMKEGTAASGKASGAEPEWAKKMAEQSGSGEKGAKTIAEQIRDSQLVTDIIGGKVSAEQLSRWGISKRDIDMANKGRKPHSESAIAAAAKRPVQVHVQIGDKQLAPLLTSMVDTVLETVLRAELHMATGTT